MDTNTQSTDALPTDKEVEAIHADARRMATITKRLVKINTERANLLHELNELKQRRGMV